MPQSLKLVKSYQLALLKDDKSQFMQCTTAPQGSGYFGGHNSHCSKELVWSDIPAGERIIGLGKKGNGTDLPSIPFELGGEFIGSGKKEKRT